MRICGTRHRNPAIKQNSLLYKYQYKSVLEEFYLSRKKNEAQLESHDV